jgi:hypothetical protein
MPCLMNYSVVPVSSTLELSFHLEPLRKAYEDLHTVEERYFRISASRVDVLASM